MEANVNAPDHEHPVFGLFDFADGLAGEAITVGPDVARLQRASEGPRESAGGGRDDIVKGRRARLEGPGGNLIVLSHCPVDTEDDRLRLAREKGAAERTFDALDPDLRAVHDSGHSLPTSLNDVL
jgi:hypothetical protein